MHGRHMNYMFTEAHTFIGAVGCAPLPRSMRIFIDYVEPVWAQTTPLAPVQSDCFFCDDIHQNYLLFVSICLALFCLHLCLVLAQAFLMNKNELSACCNSQKIAKLPQL